MKEMKTRDPRWWTRGLTVAAFALLSLCWTARAQSAPGAPSVAALLASQIRTNSATLNGLVNPNGAWFGYGPTTNYGNLSASSSPGNGTGAVRTKFNYL